MNQQIQKWKRFKNNQQSRLDHPLVQVFSFLLLYSLRKKTDPLVYYNSFFNSRHRKVAGHLVYSPCHTFHCFLDKGCLFFRRNCTWFLTFSRKKWARQVLIFVVLRQMYIVFLSNRIMKKGTFAHSETIVWWRRK